MATPKAGYFLADGTRVPGTTTIIGRYKESGGLIHWAWNEGREGRELYAKRDEAANIGTAAHAMIECAINAGSEGHQLGSDVSEAALSLYGLDDEGQRKARGAFGAYLSWASLTKLVIVAQEMSMVSERYRFGGTPDAIAIALIEGKRSMLDWKTSNGIYPDYLIQIAAYKELWEENHPDQPLTGGYHLIRFAKEHGDFSHRYYPDLSCGWEVFKLYRAAYDFDKELKARAK